MIFINNQILLRAKKENFKILYKRDNFKEMDNEDLISTTKDVYANFSFKKY